MGLFGNKKEGGLMDVIRCDEKEYLIWKWSPAGIPSKRENSIRYGSSLRVQYGEAAVFVYNQKGELDIIEGPFDQFIKTANFPVLTSIVGSAYGGNSPFQAEIYFVNLAGVIQVNIVIDKVNVSYKFFDAINFDTIPVKNVKATVTFKISDCKNFLRCHRLRDFSLDELKSKIYATITPKIKSQIAKISSEHNISALQLEEKMEDVNQIIGDKLRQPLIEDFGIELLRCEIFNLEIDTTSDNYKKIKEWHDSTGALHIKNLEDSQRINAGNMEETLRLQREEMQRAQKLQTESNFMGAHALNQQSDVLKTAATSLGQMGNMGGADGAGMNPASMMAGMMMGGAIGGQMAGMMNTMGQGMGQNMQQQINTPPPPPVIQYMALINGQQSGPFNIEQLKQLKANKTINESTYVWKQGMSNWEVISNVAELSSLLQEMMSPPPPPPNAL